MINRQYPLSWPADEPRTPLAERRLNSPFGKVGPDRTQRQLGDELRRFNAANVVLSSNVAVRNDGMVYADAARRKIGDPAVALYFDIAGQHFSICCDLYYTPDDNIRALLKIVESMRTIDRYGGRKMSNKSFAGFAALPPPPDCWKTLGISKGVGEALSMKMRREFVTDAFRERAREGHGAGRDMAALTEARDAALKQLGVA